MIEGLYIHIPFCNTKCPYCDFMSIVTEDDLLIEQYINCLKKELELYLKKNLTFNLKTVYFGGGTPSLLDPGSIKDLIEYIKTKINHSENLEITVECNPETYRYREFKILKDAGVNRISIGNQSFLKRNLIILGRKHNPQDTIEMVKSALKAGIKNINLDLIYAIPSQTINELEKDLKLYTDLPITHISAYMLTAYENTPLGSMVQNNQIVLPDEEISTSMFFFIDQFLNKKGFKRYELSNWSKTGFECKHNKLYWTHREFLGIGVSAWSFINMKRTGNERNLEKYIKLVQTNNIPTAYEEIIDEAELRKEKLFLGLRTVEGVPTSIIKNTEKLCELEKNGYLVILDDKISLTPKGLMIINQIVNFLSD